MMGKYKHLLFIGLAALLLALPMSALVTTRNAFADYSGACSQQDIDNKTGNTITSTDPITKKVTSTCKTSAATTPPSTDATKSSVDNSNSTCAIEKLGWVLCPVMETVGKIGDRAFGFLADNFLRTEPELVSNSNNGTRMAWGLARNLANIAFIIALLIIIYSQVTGAGVTNYGIKKMLPRLIVAAIAVNLSYFICQGLVDLSNIFGYEIKAFLVDTAKQVSDYAAMPPAGSIFGSSDSPGALQTIIGYALGVASLVWFLLPLMFMSAGSIVIICVVIVIILLLRKAFIVLLVVVSPIAFVLYLLPNTERYFRKWLSMLWQLLMVFPVVALLFGSGQLASAIILSSGAGANSSQEGKTYYSGKEAQCVQLPKYSTTDNNGNATGATSGGASIGTCGTNSTSVMLGLIAAGIAVAPLFAVVSVLKGALAAAGAIGGKISGAVEQGTKKAGDWGTKNTAIGRGMAARQAIKQNYKDQKFAEKMSGSGRKGRYTRIASRGISGNLGRIPGIEGVPLIGGQLNAQNSKLDANFAGAAAKIQEQEVKDQQALIQSSLNTTRADRAKRGEDDMKTVAGMLEQAIEHGDTAGIKAATNMLMTMGSAGREKIRNTMTSHGSGKAGSDEFRHHITTEHAGLKSTDADVYAAANGNGDVAAASADMNTFSGLTNEQLSSQSKLAFSGGGAAAALNQDVTVVGFDSAGKAVASKTKRKNAIVNSEAAKNITHMDGFK